MGLKRLRLGLVRLSSVVASRAVAVEVPLSAHPAHTLSLEPTAACEVSWAQAHDATAPTQGMEGTRGSNTPLPCRATLHH